MEMEQKERVGERRRKINELQKVERRLKRWSSRREMEGRKR
jgi:hypothetical protein